jgi:hypothetical protein
MEISMRWLLLLLILVMIGLLIWLPRHARKAGADLRRQVEDRRQRSDGEGTAR